MGICEKCVGECLEDHSSNDDLIHVLGQSDYFTGSKRANALARASGNWRIRVDSYSATTSPCRTNYFRNEYAKDGNHAK